MQETRYDIDKETNHIPGEERVLLLVSLYSYCGLLGTVSWVGTNVSGYIMEVECFPARCRDQEEKNMDLYRLENLRSCVRLCYKSKLKNVMLFLCFIN